MTDTTTPETRLRRLLRLASQSREVIELEWEREKRERIEAQRQMAVRLADDQTQDAFPDTLARVVQADDWAGYPALYVDGIDYEWAIAPCAVTYLDEDAWLHHTLTSQPGCMPEPRWTLIVPCVCGDYREVAVSDDYGLARDLQHIDDHRDVCFGDCAPSDLPPSADRLAELLPGQEGAA
ncbi:hypothetical protein [Streptomyces sp. STR69]|uniref:hypothetical protein n=1 Tax=Streptomyces sp. STR69 TaxID=1796942 RepID=UPI0021C58134|nr:hypothetical protein [Streptomyces sp. STR69]